MHNIKTSNISSLSLDEQKEKAYAKILRSASACEQSSIRMRKKLEYAGFSQDAIDFAMKKAIRVGVIDDVRYAECLVRSNALAGKGMEFVKKEIQSLGLYIEDLDAYQEYIQNGEDAQIDAALNLLIQHPSRAKDKRSAATRKLLNKGYSMSIASRAVAIWCDRL